MDLPAASGASGERGGETLLKRLPVLAPDVVALVLTGYGTIGGAVAALKLGAVDYLTKPLVDKALRDAVAAAMDRHTLLGGAGVADLDAAEVVSSPRGMVGRDEQMQRLYRAVAALALGSLPVLITGEAGTGKDLTARAIHAAGRAREGAALVVYHAGLVGGPGLAARWKEAAGGSLLVPGIDRLSESEHDQLLALLRADLSDDGARSGVRLIATAGPGVEACLPRALLDRVAGVRLCVPSLRARPGDLEALTDHFVKRACARTRRERTVGAAARRALAGYAWPGNLRELAGAIEHAVTLGRTPVIGPEDLPEAITRGPGSPEPTPLGAAAVDVAGVIPALAGGWTPTPLAEALRAPERRILRAALEAHDWNRNAAARDLGIDRTTLYKKIKRFGLDRPDAAG